MNTKVIGVVIVLLTIIILGFGMKISYSNSEIRLRNEIAAQQKNNENIFDAVWKILRDQAGVTDKAKDAFKEIYIPLMEGRYKERGDFMKWVQEQNPQFDLSIFKQLMASIEAHRGEFKTAQAKLIDLQREHRNLVQTFPGSIFLAGRTTPEIQLVTSGKTKESFETGEDNEPLFNK